MLQSQSHRRPVFIEVGYGNEFRPLDNHDGLDVLKCKTVHGVLKEVIVFALIDHLVRLVMGQAARRQHVAIKRISCIAAMRWLASAHNDECLPALVISPHRPGCYEPRVQKRRPKPYSLMTKPRHVLRKSLVNQVKED